MRKSLNLLFAVVLALFAFGGHSVFATSGIADGSHSVKIKTLEAHNDDESIAGSFMSDTATLSVNGDEITITIGVAKSGEGDGQFGDFDYSIEWVKIEGNEHSSESDGDKVTYYTFPLNDVKEILDAEMKYKVPGFPGLEDGHEVDFRIQLLGLDELPKAEGDSDDTKAGGEEEDNGEEPAGGDNGSEATEHEDSSEGAAEEDDDSQPDIEKKEDEDQVVENPKTGDTNNILLYMTFVIAAGLVATIIMVRKRSVSKIN